MISRDRMRRRELIVMIGGAAAAWPFAARAQQRDRPFRIGVLAPFSPALSMHLYDAFRDELAKLGFAEPRDVAFEFRWAGGQLDRLPALATELVEARVDLVLVGGTQAAFAAKKATTGVPLVVVAGSEVLGLVGSITRPAGNLTGVTMFPTDSVGKQIEALKETLQDLTRIAAIGMPSHPAYARWLADARRLASDLGVAVDPKRLADIEEIDAVLERTAADGTRAAIIFPHAAVLANRQRIAQAAIKHGIAASFPYIDAAAAGALYAFGPDVKHMFRLAARQAAKIMKGAKPADIPIEQPGAYRLAINLKTAKALGLTIPPALLARADEVIE